MKLDLSEPLRYLGVRGEPGPALLAELSGVADKLTRSVTPRYIWRVFPLSFREEGPALEGIGLTLPGGMATRMLGECSQAVLLACTLGAGFEALLRAEQARSMARAAMLDACGSAWVEAGCDAAEEEISARFPELYRTDRFSPGYGDLPLSLQPALLSALDSWRKIGVSLNESLLMTPSKSVTAVIGLSRTPGPACKRGCASCGNKGCAFRRESGK